MWSLALTYYLRTRNRFRKLRNGLNWRQYESHGIYLWEYWLTVAGTTCLNKTYSCIGVNLIRVKRLQHIRENHFKNQNHKLWTFLFNDNIIISHFSFRFLLLFCDSRARRTNLLCVCVFFLPVGRTLHKHLWFIIHSCFCASQCVSICRVSTHTRTIKRLHSTQTHTSHNHPIIPSTSLFFVFSSAYDVRIANILSS